MNYQNALNARNKKDWETPPWLVAGVEFHWGIKFTLDVAASEHNKKAPRCITQEMNSISTANRWGVNEVVWCNPPYGETEIPLFLKRAIIALRRGEAKEVVFLIPNATENEAWLLDVFPKAHEICFLIGRISFVENGLPVSGNTRGSALIFYRGSTPPPNGPKLSWMRTVDLQYPQSIPMHTSGTTF